MLLEGSCHCGAVRFRAVSHHPYPFNRCYCSICRKTAGGGGYAINLRAENDTLEVEGEDAIAVYQAKIGTGQSPAKRYFCRHCGSALWAWDPRWPEMMHPFASAIDTPLPMPPETQRHPEPKQAWRPTVRTRPRAPRGARKTLRWSPAVFLACDSRAALFSLPSPSP